ncbi:UPF0041-domain-containing protein [Pleomassaria siparia CBS 279.74]|uniref:Mitochondrial pyruvate carrier n=1 Tax=Pleomassaria siparia CBS 279.74 TaxID=1314801 RepID=A0A6G1K5Z2_9PLEO|nr:UPF0041-domain-containing protein [Pleomassaria siparia CBS 279.74]
MSHRPVARLFNHFRPMFQQPLLRRRLETAAGVGPKEPPPNKILAYLNGPVGPKTVHFWAPVCKWSIVLAGAADLTRPASQLSLTQNGALTATGAIWTRWCFVIKPQNMFLATVNFFLFLVGATQTTRIFLWQRSVAAAGEEAKAEGKEIAQGLKEAAEKVVKS